jgi:hypothetical protein
MHGFSDAQLLAYAEERLPMAATLQLEKSLESDEKLKTDLRRVCGQHLTGELSLATIWRDFQVGCLSQDQLAAYVGHQLGGALADYVRFHIDEVGCRICEARLDELARLAHNSSNEQVTPLASKCFNSSVGLIQPGAR